MTDLTEKNYYLLEPDDAVIALENKDYEIEKLNEENTKLKELLKECREILDYAKDFAYHNPCCKCITKINQALGEDK